jgi:hypothetical protein
MEGFSTPRLTEQLVLHAKPCPLGLWCHCSADRGISNPPALLLSPTMASLHRPTGYSSNSHPSGQQDHHWARTPQTCQAGNPQAHMILAGPHTSGLHRPSWSPLGPAPQACHCSHPQPLIISAGPYSSGLHRPAQSPPRLCPQAWQVSDPQAHMISDR